MRKKYQIVSILFTAMIMLFGCSELEKDEELIQQVKAEAREKDEGITIKGMEHENRLKANTSFPEHVPFPDKYKIISSTNSSNQDDIMMAITFTPHALTFEELQQMYLEFANKNEYQIDIENETENQYQLYITKENEKINLRVEMNDKGAVNQATLSYLMEENKEDD